MVQAAKNYSQSSAFSSPVIVHPLETGVDEVMVASHAFDINDRIKSYTIFSEVMNELNQAPITNNQ